MNHWNDILKQVKANHKPGQPVAVTESLLSQMTSATPVAPSAPAKVEMPYTLSLLDALPIYPL